MADRDWLFVGCEKGHDWVHIGGCNAGCGPDCGCSVPVFKCLRCYDCDYGQNEEADFLRQKCAEDGKRPPERDDGAEDLPGVAPVIGGEGRN